MSSAFSHIVDVSTTTAKAAYTFLESVVNAATNSYAVDRKYIKPAIKSGNIEALNALLDVANYGDSTDAAYEQLVKKPVFTYNESACSFAASKAVNEFLAYFNDQSKLPALHTFILLKFIDKFLENENFKADLGKIIDAMGYKSDFKNAPDLQDKIKAFCLSLCDRDHCKVTIDGFDLQITDCEPPLHCSMHADLSGEHVQITTYLL